MTDEAITKTESSSGELAQSLTPSILKLAAAELLGKQTRAEKVGLKRNTTQKMYVYAWSDFAGFLKSAEEPGEAQRWLRREALSKQEKQELLDWLEEFLPKVTHYDVIAYRTVLQVKVELAPSTITARLAALQHLFAVAQREGVIVANPADSKIVKRVKSKGVVQKHVLTMEEVQQVIVAHPVVDEITARNSMLFLLLAWSGMRRQEAGELRAEDLQQEPEALLLRLRRKGDKRDTIIVPAKLEATLTDYIEELGLDGFLFPTMKRMPDGRVIVYERPLTPDSITHIIRGMTQDALGTAYGPHRLRHFFGNEAWESGASIEMIQNYLGHGDQKTTVGYLELKPRRERSAAEMIDLGGKS